MYILIYVYIYMCVCNRKTLERVIFCAAYFNLVLEPSSSPQRQPQPTTAVTAVVHIDANRFESPHYICAAYVQTMHSTINVQTSHRRGRSHR